MDKSRLVAALIPLFGAATACVKPDLTCEDRVTCPQPGDGGTSGAAGESGSMGGGTASGGASTTTDGGAGGTTTTTTTTAGGATSSSGGGGGATSSSGGSGGSAGGGGSDATGGNGAGGTGGNPPVPCDGACGGSTPVCNEDSDTCVECLKTEDCEEGVCDTDANLCVECVETEDCEAPTPLCDEEQQLCVECLGNTDCTDAQESACDAGSCTPCQTNTDCAHLSGTTVCDMTSGVGECVECTGTDYTSCGLSPESEPLVCNSLTRTCSVDQVEHGSGTCKPCVSDAHCALGELCVEQTFNAQSVGYFCHWVEGDTEHGGPAECFANGRPYVEQIVDAESIDGQVATVCGLRTSTCPARNQFSTKNCAPEGTPDDSLCGFAPPGDAKCVQVSPTTYRCTMRCLSPDDCPGTDCDTNPLEPICEL